MVLATTDSKQFEQTQGTALSGDLSQPTHTHPFTITASLDEHASSSGSGSHSPLAQSGSHSATGLSDAGTTGYGFIQYVMCESTNQSATDQMPIGSIAYFDTNVTNGGCPSNWGPLNSASGYFIMVGNTSWNIGTPSPGAAQQGNPNWNVTVPFPTHGHSSNSPMYTFTPPVMALGGTSGGVSHLKSMDNPIDVNATLGQNTEPVVPAIALLVCQKTSGASNADGVPTNIAFYYSSTTGCPTGSGPAAGAGGNFPLGIPAGGNPSLGNYYTQGAVLGTPWSPSNPNPAHSHTLSGTLDLGDLTSPYGGSTTHYATGGSYPVSGSSGSTSIQLPFVQYLLCSANT
jgi:hypothetical protein